MKIFIEWLGGLFIILFSCWFFAPQQHPPQQHPPQKRSAQMRAWCSLDRQLDKELLAIMDRQLSPKEKLEVYAAFRVRDRALARLAREYQQRWGVSPAAECYLSSQ